MDGSSQSSGLPGSLEQRLVNEAYVEKYLTSEAHWHRSHAASQGFLGGGMLYYGFAYALRARMCVCLGSGGGFVPRVLRQAQRDMGLSRSHTILVDANLRDAGWGKPKWLPKGSMLRKEFPEILIVLNTTDAAFHKFFVPRGIKIDYLHIDADHSYEACLADFDNYSSIMAKSFVISIHDTDMPTVARVVEDLRKRDGLELIDLPDLGRGVAFVRPRLPANQEKLYFVK